MADIEPNPGPSQTISLKHGGKTANDPTKATFFRKKAKQAGNAKQSVETRREDIVERATKNRIRSKRMVG